jgi:DNA-binding transcriptional MerR regulator
LNLVGRPVGERRIAHYENLHLEQLLQIKKLTAAGLSLERIREIFNEKDLPDPLPRPKPGAIVIKSHLTIAPGLELLISPEESKMDPEQIRKFCKEIMEIAKKNFF